MRSVRKRKPERLAADLDHSIGPLEAEVLGAVAQASGPITVREVCEMLHKEGLFAYQGILNCMTRLVKKGLLERSGNARAYEYKAAVDLERFAAEITGSMLERMGGDLTRVVCRMLDIDPATGAEQINALKKRLQETERRRASKKES